MGKRERAVGGEEMEMRVGEGGGGMERAWECERGGRGDGKESRGCGDGGNRLME